MTMTDESLEILKQVSMSVGSMSPHARTHEHENARMALEGLHIALDGFSDDNLAAVSFTLASIMSSLNVLTVREMADTLERSTSAYSLVAAHLMDIYDITRDPAGSHDDGDYRPGGYL